IVGVAVPHVRESDGIGGPVIVGATKPVLLWPENFARTSDDELRAALCHELAHVRRSDYAMNLLCEMAALPLKWHPATHKVERRARSIVGSSAAEDSMAAALLNGNVMEERVMRLMRGKSTMSLRAKVFR